jgi:molecular chaperone DnaK
LVHSVSKNLSEHGEKLDASSKAEVQKAIDDAKAVSSDAPLETLKEKVQALSNASMKIGQAMYQKTDSSSSDSGNNASNNQNTEEAEFKEKSK